jgi:DNA-binding Xre family transcriptional regulator
MKLNIYNLIDKNHTKSSIQAIKNDELSIQIEKSLKILKQKRIKLKDFSKKVYIDYSTLWKFLKNRESIPLRILETLESDTGCQLGPYIIELRSGQSNSEIRFPCNINQELSQICGAIVADGHLRNRKSGRGQHYEIVIREGYESNMLALSEWFKNVFNFKPIIKKEKNHYLIYISNKIIYSIFTKVIGIPPGKKSEIVNIPKCIKGSSVENKKAFLQGLFMFDGGVEYRTGYVDLISRSKKLIKDTLSVLREIDLEPDYIGMKPDSFDRYKLRFRKNNKLKKCLILFQKNTEKWYRLTEHLEGLTKQTKDLKIALKYFDIYYPKVRENSITFSDIIKAVHKLQEADIKSIANEVDRKKTVVYEYLHKLEKWKVIYTKRKSLKKIYLLRIDMHIPWR